MAEFEYSVNGGERVRVTADLPYSVPGITATDRVEAWMIGASDVSLPVVQPTYASQGDVEFPYAGVFDGGNYSDGAVYIIAPSGITMNEPTPTATGTGESLLNGVMVNPDFSTTGETFAFDGRMAIDETKLATFPQNLVVGDIVAKVISMPVDTVDGARMGLPAQWAMAHIVTEHPPVNAISPPPVTWPGKTESIARVVDLDAVMALRPLLPLVGYTLPSITGLLARLDRFNPGLIMSNGVNTFGGYQALGLNGMNDAGLANYGRDTADSFRDIAMHFMSDTPDAQVRPLIARLIQIGSWWYDIQAGSGMHEDGNGGHHQFNYIAMLFGLVGTGRSNLISTLQSVAPENQLSQVFQLTEDHVARCAPHTNENDPHNYRLRPITAINGNVITVALHQPGDSAQVNFGGMECRRGSDDSLVGITEARDTSGNATTQTLTLPDASSLTVGDTVYFAPTYTLRVGDYAWTIENAVDKFNTFNPSQNATYLSLNTYAVEVMLARALGVFQASIAKVERYVVGRIYGTNGMPDAFKSGNLGRATRRAFWDQHAETLGVDLSISENTDEKTRSILLMGQSQLKRVLSNSSGFTNDIPKAQNVPSGVMSFYTTVPTAATDDGGATSAPIPFVVTQAEVDAGNVNPWVAASTCWLAEVLPGYSFVLGDGCVVGTSRQGLWSNDNTTRRMSDFDAMIAALRAHAGKIDVVMDWWQGSDAGAAKNARREMMPFYICQRYNGSPFTLGSPNPDAISLLNPVDEVLWDGEAQIDQLGRGRFTRDETKLSLVGWPTFGSVPTDAEMLNSDTIWDLSANPPGPRAHPGYKTTLGVPARDEWELFANDPLLADISLGVDFSGHIGEMASSDGYGSTHQLESDEFGMVWTGWAITQKIAQDAGLVIYSPKYVGYETPASGLYTDVFFSLPNGGTLSVPSNHDARLTAPTVIPPHYQPVNGFELQRASGRRYLYNEDATAYPSEFRGTAVIHTAAETHPTLGRVGRVRVTPEEPFEFGNKLHYLLGDASASALDKRDTAARMWANMLIEHVPRWHFTQHTFKMPGVSVLPHVQNIPIDVPAPAFVPTGAKFNGSTGLVNTSLSVPATNRGMISMYLKSEELTWFENNTITTFLQIRVGFTEVLALSSLSAGRMRLRLNQDGTGTDLVNLPNYAFEAGMDYHLLIAWDWELSRLQAYLNGQPVVLNYSFAGATKFEFAGQNISQIGIGSTAAAGSMMKGNLGSVWISTSQTLDLSIQANREKFALNGAPIDLGDNGQLPTGTAPEWYLNGDGPAFVNHGTAGSLQVVGGPLTSSGGMSY